MLHMQIKRPMKPQTGITLTIELNHKLQAKNGAPGALSVPVQLFLEDSFFCGLASGIGCGPTCHKHPHTPIHSFHSLSRHTPTHTPIQQTTNSLGCHVCDSDNKIILVQSLFPCVSFKCCQKTGYSSKPHAKIEWCVLLRHAIAIQYCM